MVRQQASCRRYSSSCLESGLSEKLITIKQKRRENYDRQ